MGKSNTALLAFNRGIVSPLALGRIDMKRLAMSAEEQVNWMPWELGPMTLRPGLQYIGSTYNNLITKYIPFIFSTDNDNNKALIELTTKRMRVRVGVNADLVTRPDVDTVVVNGTFTQHTDTVTITIASPGVLTYTGADAFSNNDPITLQTTGALPTGFTAGTTYYIKNVNTGTKTFQLSATAGGAAINTSGTQSGVHTVYAYYYISGWTDNDETGAVSKWYTGNTMSLVGNGVNAAIRDQELSVTAIDVGVEHAINLTVTEGPVFVRVGSTLGDDDYLTETMLDPGTHSLAFIPYGTSAFVRIIGRNKYRSCVSQISIESAGPMELQTPWLDSDFNYLRWEASGDIIFVACRNKQQHKIERRGVRSWSIAVYESNDGPFKAPNITPIRLSVAAISGNTTLTSTADLFKEEHVGGLFSLASYGQQVAASASGADQWTDPIRVTGIDAGRQFGLIITGTWSGTIRLQRSIEEPGSWADVTSYTTNQNTTYSDTLNNQIIYYRIGFKVAEYTSGTANLTLTYSSGSITGVGRVTEYVDAKNVNISVLRDFGGTASTDDWSEGAWSNVAGWPSSVVLNDGRLCWAGKDKHWESVSDGYTSFDPDYEGDAGPISRSIGSGPVDVVEWMLSAGRLFMGGQGAEYAIRSSSIDEPITPTNFNMKTVSTLGSAPVPPLRIDTTPVFIEVGGIKVREIVKGDGLDEFMSNTMNELCPEVAKPSIIRSAVQRKPDTRLHFVRSDGKVAVLIFNAVESVRCWMLFETDGYVEDVVVLPDSMEEAVFYVVRRVIDGVTVRYLEKWARMDEAVGGTVNKMADSFFIYSGSPSSVITQLDHLEGKDVVVWANSSDIGTYRVANGAINLDISVDYAIIGLYYEGRFKSSRLTYPTQLGVPMNQRAMVLSISFILANTHAKGLQYGNDFDTMDDLPEIEDGVAHGDSYLWGMYSKDAIEFPGEWSADARVCLKGMAPRPCTVVAAVVGIESHEK